MSRKGRGGGAQGGHRRPPKIDVAGAVDLSGLGKGGQKQTKPATAAEAMVFCQNMASQLYKGYAGLLNQVQQLQVEQ